MFGIFIFFFFLFFFVLKDQNKPISMRGSKNIVFGPGLKEERERLHEKNKKEFHLQQKLISDRKQMSPYKEGSNR